MLKCKRGKILNKLRKGNIDHSSRGTRRSCSRARDPGFIHDMCCDLDSALHMCLVLTLCNPKDCSPPGSSLHGISQERILEGVASPLTMGPSCPGIKSESTALASGFFNSKAPGKPTLV